MRQYLVSLFVVAVSILKIYLTYYLPSSFLLPVQFSVIYGVFKLQALRSTTLPGQLLFRLP